MEDDFLDCLCKMLGSQLGTGCEIRLYDAGKKEWQVASHYSMNHPEDDSACVPADPRSSSPSLPYVSGLLEDLINEGIRRTGQTVDRMNRAERKAAVRYLDQHGAFLITKAGTRVCERLGISKFTLYSLLDEIHSEN